MKNISNLYELENFKESKILIMFDDSDIMYAEYKNNQIKITYENLINHNIIYLYSDNINNESFSNIINLHIEKNLNELNRNIYIINGKFKMDDKIISVIETNNKTMISFNNEFSSYKEVIEESGNYIEELNILNNLLYYKKQVDDYEYETIYKTNQNNVNLKNINYENLEPIKEKVKEFKNEK